MTTPIIQLKKLGVTLSGSEILRAVSLSVAEGEYLSIVGPNGAGKTTLIKCMAGIYRDWTGSILVDGKSFGAYDSKSLARLQSYVPQAEGRSNPLTVAEFVAMGRYPYLSAFTTLKPDDYLAIDQAIARAGLEPFRQRKMNTLSGGERQMAFIAAALAQEAKILLLDEPSTFLDYRHQAEVAAILQSACRESGITVVAVHHDMNMAAASSDRILALKEGGVVFCGTPEEIMQPPVLEKIYDTTFSCVSTGSGCVVIGGAGQ